MSDRWLLLRTQAVPTDERRRAAATPRFQRVEAGYRNDPSELPELFDRSADENTGREEMTMPRTNPDDKSHDEDVVADLVNIPGLASDLLLAEYKALRDEIVKKMDHRTTLVVCSVTVSSAVLGFGIDRKSAPLLLVSPLVSLLLGILILYTNRQIGLASGYLRTRFDEPIIVRYHQQIGWHESNLRKHSFGFQTLNFRIPLAMIAGTPVVVSVPNALSNIGNWTVTVPILVVVILLLTVYTIQTFRL